MGYSTTAGVQGICPSGWHIPTDNEWLILEGTVDSQYGVGSSEWNGTAWRDYDAGGKLKEAGLTHWNSPNIGATNSSGFTALPGGYRSYYGNFNDKGYFGYFWSSSVYSSASAWYRRLDNSVQKVYRGCFYRSRGYSIRCLRD